MIGWRGRRTRGAASAVVHRNGREVKTVPRRWSLPGQLPGRSRLRLAVRRGVLQVVGPRAHRSQVKDTTKPSSPAEYMWSRSAGSNATSSARQRVGYRSEQPARGAVPDVDVALGGRATAPGTPPGRG